MQSPDRPQLSLVRCTSRISFGRGFAPTLVAAAALLVAACACPPSSYRAPSASRDGERLAAAPPPLYKGLGDHTRTVTTSSPLAQKYFNQGLTWAYAFNHDEAIRAFTYAAELDPACAMAHWGVALCHGPHINNPVMTPDRSRDAHAAIQRALALRAACTPVERALIDALAQRYAPEHVDDRVPFDRAYADAMRSVYSAYPNDDDIATLFAESMMDLRPWDLWTQEANPQPQPGTEEIIATLQHALTLNPKNPGANHLLIHAVESSPHPELAKDAADRLRTLVPAAGHLVHMPAHIDVQLGSWPAAATANVRAIAADNAYTRISQRQGFYRVYMVHNHHFLAFVEMMRARRESTLRAAREMIDSVPASYIEESAPLIDPYMSIVYDAQKRFGLWEEILQEPAPDSRLVITTAMWRFSRALSFAALHRVEEARAEQQRFRAAVAAVPQDAMMAINPAHTVLSIAEHMLQGEIAIAEGRTDDAVRHLTDAVAIEDTLRYMEPPEWIQPVRHALGAVLNDAGRFADAEAVYREDLRIWPENAWSLQGLHTALTGQGRADAAAAIAPRLARAWADADIAPTTSCLCVPQRRVSATAELEAAGCSAPSRAGHHLAASGR